MKYVYMFLIILLISACNNSNKQSDNQDEIKIMQYEALFDILNSQKDVLYVVNFWATWCSPCVEELPDFVEVDQELRENKSYKMLLVSLDAASDIEDVKLFKQTHNISPQVLLLDDIRRMNDWIPMVEPYWGGAIPATLFYRNGKRLQFVEGKLNKEELLKHINKFL
jgi:thiol-disulfide isomerase/thioredoxin